MSQTSARNTSVSNEWYTPEWILDPVRESFGGSIGFDPCSCVYANKTVQAEDYYTMHDDGLSMRWCITHQTVWMNPPYGKTGLRSNVDIWCERFYDQVIQGNPTQGIPPWAVLLRLSHLEHSWPQILLQYSHAYIPQRVVNGKLQKRVRFVNPKGVEGPLPSAASVLLVGHNADHSKIPWVQI